MLPWIPVVFVFLPTSLPHIFHYCHIVGGKCQVDISYFEVLLCQVDVSYFELLLPLFSSPLQLPHIFCYCHIVDGKCQVDIS